MVRDLGENNGIIITFCKGKRESNEYRNGKQRFKRIVTVWERCTRDIPVYSMEASLMYFFKAL